MFTFFGVIFLVILLLLIGYGGCLYSLYSFYPKVFKQLVMEIKAKDMEAYDKVIKNTE